MTLTLFFFLFLFSRAAAEKKKKSLSLGYLHLSAEFVGRKRQVERPGCLFYGHISFRNQRWLGWK